MVITPSSRSDGPPFCSSITPAGLYIKLLIVPLKQSRAWSQRSARGLRTDCPLLPLGLISMTKLRAVPGVCLPGAPGDCHLDSRHAQPRRAHSGLAEAGARPRGPDNTGLMEEEKPLQLPREPPGSLYPDQADKQASSWDPNGNGGGGKKKNYQRYPKPPYSYLAMIAMVIQNSPEKKLTLSEILKEISTLFPFFKGNYKGWRDSVRHNLSSYDCFVKVLKDPGKPQGKGNFWAVEVSRVPLELLKRQNTAVSRQDETIFAQDLAPYILQGHPHTHRPETHPSEPPLPHVPSRHSSPAPEDPYRPKLDSSFAIDSLLHSIRPASTAEDGIRARDSWGLELPPHGRITSPLRPRYTSSNRSASASSTSPASSSSDEDWRGLSRYGKRGSDGDPGSDGYDDSCLPPNKIAKRGSAPPWELPTSYAKYTPPNAVAPPSMRFNGNPFMPLGGIPFYSYGTPHVAPSHFSGHAYWPLLPSGRVSLQAPPLLMDLDSMLQSVPPNKSVFDVLGAPNQTVHPPPTQYALQNGPPLSRYSQC
ncbi:forkhead box protein H1 isoform X1 [Astyanax mexicanus]|uniref:Forkhead box H1 n=2 Tax=Astyanax mexicanus TaxID=7994 RepID=A0A8B9I1X5_ASTMX|nr:forkhead box protein H1 isoform X1 [Astyanax mexicanus]KAG9267553.1 forkhead box protein H1-like isoform X1 [Astyanax mexicanus]